MVVLSFPLSLTHHRGEVIPQASVKAEVISSARCPNKKLAHSKILGHVPGQ